MLAGKSLLHHNDDDYCIVTPLYRAMVRSLYSFLFYHLRYHVTFRREKQMENDLKFRGNGFTLSNG